MVSAPIPPANPQSPWPSLGSLIDPVSNWIQRGTDYYQQQLANIGKSPSGIDFSVSPDTLGQLMALGGPIGEGGGFRAGRNRFMIPKNPSYVESQAAGAAPATALPEATPEATDVTQPAPRVSRSDALLNEATRRGTQLAQNPAWMAWAKGGRKGPEPYVPQPWEEAAPTPEPTFEGWRKAMSRLDRQAKPGAQSLDIEDKLKSLLGQDWKP